MKTRVASSRPAVIAQFAKTIGAVPSTLLEKSRQLNKAEEAPAMCRARWPYSPGNDEFDLFLRFPNHPRLASQRSMIRLISEQGISTTVSNASPTSQSTNLQRQLPTVSTAVWLPDATLPSNRYTQREIASSVLLVAACRSAASAPPDYPEVVGSEIAGEADDSAARRCRVPSVGSSLGESGTARWRKRLPRLGFPAIRLVSAFFSKKGVGRAISIFFVSCSFTSGHGLAP